MGIEPTKDRFHGPSLVLKTKPSTSNGNAPRALAYCDRRERACNPQYQGTHFAMAPSSPTAQTAPRTAPTA